MALLQYLYNKREAGELGKEGTWRGGAQKGRWQREEKRVRAC